MTETPEFTGTLVGSLCVKLATEGSRAVFAEGLPRLDPDALLATVSAEAEKRGVQARVGLLGGRLNGVARHGRIEVTTDELVANQWRNDEAARSGVVTITVALAPVQKLNSLRTAVQLVGVREVRTELRNVAVSWEDQSTRRHLWSALERRTRDVPTDALLEYAAGLSGMSGAALLEEEPRRLHMLGVLPSNGLTSSSGPAAVERALMNSANLVAQLEDPSDQHHERLVEASEGEDRERAAAAQALLRFASTGERSELKGLTYELVRDVLGKTSKRKDDDGDGGDEPGTPPARRERVEGDQLVIDLLLDGDEEEIRGAADTYDKTLEPDGGDDAGALTVSGAPVQPQAREGMRQGVELFGKLLTEDAWGGLVLADDAADFISAMKMLAAEDAVVRPFLFHEKGHVLGMVRRGVDVGMIAPSTLDALERYAAARGC